MIELQDLPLWYKKTAKLNYSFYLELVHHGNYRPYRHHLAICEALERIERGELKRLMIFMPPRHGKSQTVTESYPSWYLGRNPNDKVMVVSYGDSLSKQFGRKNRSKFEEFGETFFGHSLAHDNNTLTSFSIEGHTGGALFSSVNGGLTGQGASLLIVDDPIKSRKEAESKTYRDNVYDEYQSSMLTRLTPSGAIILIMTRWNEDDLAGRILKEEGADKWEILSLPILAEEGDLLGRDPGEPLWSEFGFDKEWIEERKKAIGSRAFNSLYQQRPTPDGGSLLKRKWFNYYKELPELEEQLISVDATFKDTEKSDFCVLQVWGKKGANRYLVDQVRDRMDFPTTVQAIRNLSIRYPKANAKIIEDKANGSAVIDYLKNEISGLIPINPDGGKISRTSAVSPIIEAGNVHLPEKAHYLQDFIEECVIFPNGANDDQLDCMTQALNYMNKPTEIFFGRA